MGEQAVYATLFATAFGAATVFPIQSEPVVVWVLLKGHSPWVVLFVASVANVLGSAVNYVLGRGIARFRDRRWFPASPGAMARAERWYQRFGKWSLLLSWAPFIGDPLTITAGVLREPLGIFLLLVGIAKTGRYVLVIVATMGTS